MDRRETIGGLPAWHARGGFAPERRGGGDAAHARVPGVAGAWRCGRSSDAGWRGGRFGCHRGGWWRRREFAVAPGGEELIEGRGEAAELQPEQNLDAGTPHAFGDGTFQFGE